jgi:2-polyprenyl-3-methyl-5-hydroxy-6-metoxy-1,4-benzoquinol methylase
MNQSNQPNPPTDSYFDRYWKKRFNASSYQRHLNSLQRNYDAHLPRGNERVLEIGPGFGELLEFLRSRGLKQIEAIDIDADMVAALQSRGFENVRCVEDASADLQSRGGQYDCVIARHVLEHLDPASGLELLLATFESLAPGGRVIIEVPNMANFITAPYARWADYTHRNGFTHESLTAALSQAGFEVTQSFGIARPVRSLAELAAWCGQAVTQAIAWTLLKANYPQAHVIAAPAIAAVGIKPAGRAS